MVMYALAAMLLPLAMAGSIGYQQMQSGMPMQQGWGNSGWGNSGWGNSGWGNQGYGKDVLVCVFHVLMLWKRSIFTYRRSLRLSFLVIHYRPTHLSE